MSAGLRLAIFDMDGTLIDSLGAIIAAMRGAYAAMGAPPPHDDAIRSIVGLSLPEVFRVLSPEADNAAMVAAYKDSFITLREAKAGLPDAPLYPGARATLEGLAGRGWLLSVATGKARRGFDHAVETHGLHGLFSHPQTADIARSKPHPEMVERCLDLHGAAAADAVMIGDTTFDIEMARAAGVRAIGVGWGYHETGALLEAGAERVVRDFGELHAMLEAET